MLLSVKEKVLDMCRMSSLVYLGTEEMKLRYKQHNIPVLKRCVSVPKILYNDASTCNGQAFLSLYDNEGLLVFKGGDSIQESMHNFNVERVKMEVGGLMTSEEPLVHFGFIRQYRCLEDEIISELQHYINDHNIKTLNIAGHSVGGALASVAAIQLHHEFPTLDISCYTFGSPRPGNKQFSHLFKKSVKNSYRFVNASDVVTTIPSSRWFCHVDSGEWFYENQFYQRWFTFRHRFRSFVNTTLISSPSFHSIDKYYEDIKNKWNKTII